MRVLVTGGPGFIGRRVVSRFLDAGWDVASFSLPGEGPAAAWSRPVDMFYGDLCDAEAVSRAARGCALAIHLAAPVGVAGEYDWHWREIVEGTRTVCSAVANGGGRLLVASSIAVYGTSIQTQLCREEDGHGPWAGAYGWAKQGQERVALEIAQAMQAPLTLIRPANVYGLGGASAWGDRLIASMRSSGAIVIGDATRNNAGLVYVENLADAIFAAATRSEAIGRTYNVCDEEEVSWQRFMEDMARIAGVSPPVVLPLESALALVGANEDPARKIPPRDPALGTMEGLNLVGFDNRIDSNRIRKELGWRPLIGYAQALDEIASHYSVALN